MATKKRRFGNIRKRASGRYQARYLGPDGIERTAPHTFETEREALAWLTVTEASIIQKTWTAPESGEIKLAVYATKWIGERKLAPRTREIYESLYKLNIGPYLGEQMISAIKPATIRTWRKRLLDDGRPEVQAVKAYRVLRAILNTAVNEDEIITKNPCRIKGFDRHHTDERPTAGIAQVYGLAATMPERFQALIILAALSGLRWGELIALRRCDVDLDAGTVRVPRKLSSVRGKLEFGPPKTEAGVRTVALPTAAITAMRQHLDEIVKTDAPEALIFLGERGGLLRSCNFRRAVKWPEAVKKAGLPVGFHFHDLRHTGNNIASASGASTRELMHRMGHASMRAALIYQHATSERDQEIAKNMDKRIKAAERAAKRKKPDEDEDGSAGVLVPV